GGVGRDVARRLRRQRHALRSVVVPRGTQGSWRGGVDRGVRFVATQEPGDRRRARRPGRGRAGVGASRGRAAASGASRVRERGRLSARGAGLPVRRGRVPGLRPRRISAPGADGWVVRPPDGGDRLLPRAGHAGKLHCGEDVGRGRGSGSQMIITRTPFRITLGGGGTDLPSYYEKHGGFIFAAGMDKYMYIMLNPPIVDDKIRLHYSRIEVVDHVSEIQHDLAREALRYHGIERKIEISSLADLPDGTGLGSSSAYLVGLLTALHHYRRDFVPLQALAEEACHIELEVLGKRIGKQDQYMAVYGGFTVLEIDQVGR